MPRNEDSVNLNNCSSGTSHCQLTSSETHTTGSKKSWYSFRGPLYGSAWLRLLHSLPSHMWHHLHEVIWLTRHQHGAWNKNGIGHSPDYFSPLCAINSLNTRLQRRLWWLAEWCHLENVSSHSCLWHHDWRKENAISILEIYYFTFAFDNCL